MVESSSAAAMRRPSGLTRTQRTSSDILSVRAWRADSRRAAGACPADPFAPALRISHSQNFTLWSALQLTNPLPSGSGTTDHTWIEHNAVRPGAAQALASIAIINVCQVIAATLAGTAHKEHLTGTMHDTSLRHKGLSVLALAWHILRSALWVEGRE